MPILRVLRFMILAMASCAYLANGAQAHLQISHGESLDLMLCSTGTERVVQLHLPSEPAEETEDTCCGDCAPSPVILYASPDVVRIYLCHALATRCRAAAIVYPRSPLWPGAPPNGPPIRLTINA